MIWVSILKLVLQLAAFIARRAEQTKTEQGLRDEIDRLHKTKVDDAARARDDVLSGRVPVDPDDPNRRD